MFKIEGVIAKGYDIGYTTVCNAVNKIEGSGDETYIKAVYHPGNSCEFDSIKGSYTQMVYDTMKVAVKRFISPTEKEPTDALLKLSIYYGFDFRFCNTQCGNEKGHVERNVGYV